MGILCNSKTLNQENPGPVCPGVEVLTSAVEAHFTELQKGLKCTIEDAFKVQLEQATGFAWEERKVLKCVLGWAKNAKDEDNRVKAWVWGLVGSAGTGLTVGLIMHFVKG